MTIVIDDSAVKRITELRQSQGKNDLMLRIIIEGGGCSGFQYKMELTDDIKESDEVFENAVITDDVSMPFLIGSVIRFEDSLIGSEFKIDNPNAKSGCGCGTSFSINN